MNIHAQSARHRLIRPWIYVCMACVFFMVMIGGITRLTESGLSIVEWKLVTGILPPMSDAAWEKELADYRTSPQYQKINKGMSVSEFKQIFWLEYIHRVIGRITGLLFALPFLYFLLTKKMNKALSKRMAVACILVGAQGLIGWLMVKSGLQNDPRVSPIRLAMHLSMAFIVFNLLLWTVMQLRQTSLFTYAASSARHITTLILILLSLQIIFGAFVAGMDAGLTYNTFPLMDGEFIPQGLMMLDPWHHNFVENIVTVQFQHRTLAMLLCVAIIAFTIWRWRDAGTAEKNHLLIVLFLLFAQFLLGVFTLIMVVPIDLASTHQMMALILSASLVSLLYRYQTKSTDSHVI